MLDYKWTEIMTVFRTPPEDIDPGAKQENTYREVISLQAILVTATIALLAYIQKEPLFQVRAEVIFALLAGVPLVGLYNVVRGRRNTPQGEIFVYTRPVRVYARQVLFLAILVVIGASYMYWQGLLPGQEAANSPPTATGAVE
ncbi:MAG: hypothetical protein AB7O68_08155 [Pirellulales bacterium]